jgi:hypothetical protein
MTQPSSAMPDALRRLSRLRVVSYAVLGVIALLFTGALGLMTAALRTWGLLQQTSDVPGSTVDGKVLDHLDTMVSFGQLVWVLALIAMSVFLNRATRAVLSLGGGPLRYGPRWAAFGFFVPIACLVVPKRVMDDLWVWSVEPDDRGRPVPRNRWIGWVWGVFVTVALLDRLLGMGPTDSGTTALGAVIYAVDLVVPVAAMAYVLMLVRRLEARAAALGLAVPAGVPARGQRLAVPLAAVAALVALSGSAVAATRGASVPEGAVIAPDVASALADIAPVETPYTLTAGPVTIQLASEPTREVSREKLSGGTAVNTTWSVSTPLHDQVVMTYVLPRSMEFTVDARGMLKESARGAKMVLGPMTSGRLGKNAWAQAEVTASDGSTAIWRVLLVGQVRVDVIASQDEMDELVATMRLRGADASGSGA